MPPSSFALFISQRLKNSSFNSPAERRNAFFEASLDWKSLTKTDKNVFFNFLYYDSNDLIQKKIHLYKIFNLEFRNYCKRKTRNLF